MHYFDVGTKYSELNLFVFVCRLKCRQLLCAFRRVECWVCVRRAHGQHNQMINETNRIDIRMRSKSHENGMNNIPNTFSIIIVVVVVVILLPNDFDPNVLVLDEKGRKSERILDEIVSFTAKSIRNGWNDVKWSARGSNTQFRV